MFENTCFWQLTRLLHRKIHFTELQHRNSNNCRQILYDWKFHLEKKKVLTEVVKRNFILKSATSKTITFCDNSTLFHIALFAGLFKLYVASLPIQNFIYFLANYFSSCRICDNWKYSVAYQSRRILNYIFKPRWEEEYMNTKSEVFNNKDFWFKCFHALKYAWHLLRVNT